MKLDLQSDEQLRGCWVVIDRETFDGATDAGRLGGMKGLGKTEQEAIADYLEARAEYEAEKC